MFSLRLKDFCLAWEAACCPPPPFPSPDLSPSLQSHRSLSLLVPLFSPIPGALSRLETSSPPSPPPQFNGSFRSRSSLQELLSAARCSLYVVHIAKSHYCPASFPPLVLPPREKKNTLAEESVYIEYLLLRAVRAIRKSERALYYFERKAESQSRDHQGSDNYLPLYVAARCAILFFLN